MKTKLLGPPGTGKTTKMMEYLEKELENGTHPERIAFLTFTRAARIEALERTCKTEKDFPYLKTIHSICYHQLNISKDQIVRPESLRSFGKQIGIKLTGSMLDPWIEEFTRGIDAPTRDDILIQLNHCGRHRKSTLKEALMGRSTEIDYKYALWFTNAYSTWKLTNGMVDYTDLLSKYIEYGKPLDVDAMFVDEAQDLSELQWEAVSRLGGLAKRWYIAGDDDQAIFHWAGADATAFQNLQTEKTEVLNKSYRVSKAVHKAAMEIVSKIKRRLPKEYSSTESEGEVSSAGHFEGLNFDEKTFILFRNHYRGADIARSLKDNLIPFIGKGSPLNDADTRMALYAFYLMIKGREIPQIYAKSFLKYSDDEYTNSKAALLIKDKKVLRTEDILIEKPKPSDWTKVLGELPNRMVLASYIASKGILAVTSPKIEVLSIHQSKGRETHTVVIDPEMSRACWLGMLDNPDDEHRVWYVGVTRAKERVFYMLPDGQYSYRF